MNRKTSLSLAVLILLPLTVQAQGTIVRGAVRGATTGIAAETAVKSAVTTVVAESAARSAVGATWVVVPNATTKATSNALINGKVDITGISSTAGMYDHRAIIEYSSEQGSILNALDNYRLQTGVQNWDKPILTPVEPIYITPTPATSDPALIRSVEDSRAPKDIKPYKPLYDPEYVNPQTVLPKIKEVRSLARQYAQDLPTEDILHPICLIKPEDQQAFIDIVPDMKQINYEIYEKLDRIANGHRQDIVGAESFAQKARNEQLLRKMSEVQQKLPVYSKAISSTQDIINKYQHIVDGEYGILFKSDWINPVAFDPAAFQLSGSGLQPTLEDWSFAFSAEKRQQIIDQIHAQMPSEARIAVINDNSKIHDIYKAAKSNGYLPEGFTIDYFTDAQSFLTAHHNRPFDVVMADRRFEGGGGEAVTRILRSENDNTLIVHNSSWTQKDVWDSYRPEQLQPFYDEGYSAYFPAPLRSESGWGEVDIEGLTPQDVMFALRNLFQHANSGRLMPFVPKAK